MRDGLPPTLDGSALPLSALAGLVSNRSSSPLADSTRRRPLSCPPLQHGRHHERRLHQRLDPRAQRRSPAPPPRGPHRRQGGQGEDPDHVPFVPGAPLSCLADGLTPRGVRWFAVAAPSAPCLAARRIPRRASFVVVFRARHRSGGRESSRLGGRRARSLSSSAHEPSNVLRTCGPRSSIVSSAWRSHF